MSNEGKACDAVLKVLEARTGYVRRDISFPEKEQIDPPVELRVRLGEQGFGFEHTRLEPFEGQIAGDTKFAQFIRPVTEKLSGTLPKPGLYRVWFPLNANLKAKGTDLPQFQSKFIDWVCETAAAFHTEHPTVPTKEESWRGITQRVSESPPDFPFEVSLHRELHWARSGIHDGVLLAARVLSEKDDLESLRAERLQRTLTKKCPKLKRCKEDGARTVLVLEDNDMILSNYGLIHDALTKLLATNSDLPDEIHLVTTSVQEWDVRTLYCDGDMGPVDDRTDFDSAYLIDITGSERAS